MKTRYIMAPIVMLAILVALSMPAMAGNLDELETRCWDGCLNGTITNGTVIVLCNMTELPTVGNWTITLPNGTVEIAYVHWHRWAACHGTDPTAEFWNGTGVYESISFPYPDQNVVAEDHGVWYTDYNPRNGNHHYYWKVNASAGTNTFNATGCYETTGEHCDAMWFVAVINETDKADRTHTGHWWHNTGYRKTNSSAEQKTWYYNASGNPINSTADYTLWVAQSHYGITDPPIEFNGHEVGTVGSGCCGHGEGDAQDFSLCKFNVPGTYIEADGSQNVTWKYTGIDEYYVNFGTLAGAILEQDLEITDITANATTLRANNSYKINATVKNTGSENVTATFNLSLYVNGSYYTNTSVSGLDTGESETVSFTRLVNLTNGCHNFTVVADCDGDVNESDEDNNATTVNYQVGYVIAVEKNSDFDDLVNESKNGTFGDGNVSKTGDTYYLQNFTIENCAGSGITIENTNAKFVIMNCTIHNCCGGVAGVYFHNLSNGTINDSTVKDNTGKGIRIQKSTCVNITNNTVQNNTAYGIDVYPETLLPENIDDSKFVNISYNTLENNSYGIELIGYNCTVHNNTIRNNTAYGIYLYGNYIDLTYNNITYNGDYGIKAYNSYTNDIDHNNFTDNNADNSGHQAWDNGDNDWNTTTTGNNWSDWQSNPGYPHYYYIDGGNNKDHAPNGVITITLEVYNATKYDKNDPDTDVTSKVNTTDDEHAKVEVNRGTCPVGNVTLNFSGSISGTINSVSFNYEHREVNLDDVWIEALDANGTWVYYDATKSEEDVTSNCSVTSTINTVDEANNASIRYVCERTGSGNPAGSGYLDCANLTITYTP